MKKASTKLGAVLVTLVMICNMISVFSTYAIAEGVPANLSITEFEEFSGGTGTKDDPYKISNASQLSNVRNYRHGNYYELAQNIDLTEYIDTYGGDIGWTPIGDMTGWEQGLDHFYGGFDGKGYTISGLWIKHDANDDGNFANYSGLFGKIGEILNETKVSEVKNLSIVIDEKGITEENVFIGGVGGIAGTTYSTTIENCSVTGSKVTSSANQVGGIVGTLIDGMIVKSYTNIDVSGDKQVGGIVGYANRSNINDCYSRFDNLSSTTTKTGGIVGQSWLSVVKNCYVVGDTISGDGEVGGLIGNNEDCSVFNSFVVVNNLNSISDVGGIIGKDFNGKADTTSSYIYDGIKINGEALTEDEEINTLSPAEFWTKGTYSSFDFENVWVWDEEYTYPKLKEFEGQEYPYSFYFYANPYFNEEENDGMIKVVPHKHLANVGYAVSEDETLPSADKYTDIINNKVSLPNGINYMHLKGVFDDNEVRTLFGKYNVVKNGIYIDAIKGDDKVTVSVENYTDSEEEVYVYVAEYDKDKKLVKVILKSDVVGSDAKKDLEIEYLADKDNEVKLFVWDKDNTPLMKFMFLQQDEPEPTPTPEPTPYYSQNYEEVANMSTVWTSQSSQVDLGVDDKKGRYALFEPGAQGGGRSAYTDFKPDLSGVDQYVVELDMTIDAGTQGETNFALKTGDIPAINSTITSNYLFKLSTSADSKTWAINDVSAKGVTLDETAWYHYSVMVDKKRNLASVTITKDGSDTAILDKEVVSINGNADITGIYLLGGRYYPLYRIDNIIVRDVNVNDKFGELGEEFLNSISFTKTPPVKVTQPVDGENADYQFEITALGTNGNDVTNEEGIEVKWEVLGLENEDGYVTLSGFNENVTSTNLNVKHGVSNYFVIVKAIVTWKEITQEIMYPFAIIGTEGSAGNRVYPAPGFPVNLNDYPDSLLGYSSISNAINSQDPILAHWSIYGSNGARTLKLAKEKATGDKYMDFASNGGGGTTVAVLRVDENTSQFITDMKIKFASDMKIGWYYTTPNNPDDANPTYEISYAGGAFNCGIDTISGISTDTWYRMVISVDRGIKSYSVWVYDDNDALMGSMENLTIPEKAYENSPRYFCLSGSFPISMKDMIMYTPIMESMTVNSDIDVAKVPENANDTTVVELSANCLSNNGILITGEVVWSLEDEYENVELEVTGPQTASLKIRQGAEGTVKVNAVKEGKSASKEIMLTQSGNMVLFTTSTSSITIPFAGEDSVVAEYFAKEVDKDGKDVESNIIYSILGKDGSVELTTMPKGVAFDKTTGKLTVEAGAVPTIVYIKATVDAKEPADRISSKTKVNIHGLDFVFGSAENEELTRVLDTQYSDSLGYGFESTTGITVNENNVQIPAKNRFKVKVPNGNYTVSLETTSGRIYSEVIDGIPAFAGTNKGSLGEANATTPAKYTFGVAVCDGVLDIMFNGVFTGSTQDENENEVETFGEYSQITSFSISQMGAKQPLEKPSVYAMGDSTTNSGAEYLSWGQVANPYFAQSDVFSGFFNHGKAGDDSVVYYNNNRVENILLAINPGDYVTVNMGINSRAAGEGDSYETIMRKYVVEGILQRGGIPVILTATPQGPVAAGSYDKANYRDGVFYCDRNNDPNRDARNSILRKIAADYDLDLIDLSVDINAYFNTLTMDDVANPDLWGTYQLEDGEVPTTILQLAQSWYRDHNHYHKPLADYIAKYVLAELEEIQAK